MNKHNRANVRVEKALPDWPKFESIGDTMRLTGRYRSPRFFLAWKDVTGAIFMVGIFPFMAVVYSAYPQGSFTGQDFFLWLVAWVVLVPVMHVWCQHRLFRSRLDIEVTPAHVRIGRQFYNLDDIVSVDWDIHDEVNNHEKTDSYRRFYARCFQIAMLYGARYVEVAGIYKDKQKAEALALMLQKAITMARSRMMKTEQPPAPVRQAPAAAPTADVELPR